MCFNHLELLLVHTLIHISIAGNPASLNCTPQDYVCDGHQVVCNCTATCGNIIHWWDNNTVTFCTRTQYCDDMDLKCPPPVCTEVITRNNCNSSSSSGTFTSRLNFTANLEMERIQIGCFTTPDAAVNNSTNRSMPSTNESCTPVRELSSEENSVTMWHVTNCTGMYVELQHCNKYKLPDMQNETNCWLQFSYCGLVSPLVIQPYIFPVQHSRA